MTTTTTAHHTTTTKAGHKGKGSVDHHDHGAPQRHHRRRGERHQHQRVGRPLLDGHRRRRLGDADARRCRELGGDVRCLLRGRASRSRRRPSPPPSACSPPRCCPILRGHARAAAASPASMSWWSSARTSPRPCRRRRQPWPADIALVGRRRGASAGAPATLAAEPERSALFLDFDGTLSAVVVDPVVVLPLPGVPALLAELATAFALVAVISGRPTDFLADVLERSPASRWSASTAWSARWRDPRTTPGPPS